MTLFVIVTKYEELDEVHAELKLKQLLCDSINQWDELIKMFVYVSVLSDTFFKSTTTQRLSRL